MAKSMQKPVVVIPNFNGGEALKAAVGSLKAQSLSAQIVVVDNASTDGSTDFIESNSDIELIKHKTNRGYAGGVNPGLKMAIELGATYAAPFNDDAIADKDWLKKLVEHLDAHLEAGAACCKVLKDDKSTIDSTGDYFTSWGLPYPRGRDEKDSRQYDELTQIFSASGAASLYRVSALKEVGLLDEDFFAYYEDVDLSFRLQLADWKVGYVPESIVYHAVGMTSSRIKGFTTYQTMKNLPLLAYKNVPQQYLTGVMLRLTLARTFFLGRALTRGQLWPALKGDIMATYLLAKKVRERKRIQASKKVSDEYIWDMMVHDLPPNAYALRKFRRLYWKLTFRKKP